MGVWRQRVPKIAGTTRNTYTADFPSLTRDHVIDHASSRCILASIKLHTTRPSKCVSIGWNFHVRFASTSQLGSKGEPALRTVDTGALERDTQSCIHTINGLARMWREHPITHTFIHGFWKPATYQTLPSAVSESSSDLPRILAIPNPMLLERYAMRKGEPQILEKKINLV
ncbi:hypothetical protein CIB48_g6951 [Xylaria polymorpha]|nr:hypothetical protein CIB48_g6951 [Xylaria polymorpha]